jgi:hydroxymethylbilane synthase
MRLATRSSPQAHTQALRVAEALMAAHEGLQVELVFVDTLGDQRLDVPLHHLGGQGIFVKEVQAAVLAGRADAAVHSAKDLPSQPTPGLVIGAFCERRDARDALVGASLDALQAGSVVATGSVRRRAQLRRLRPQITFAELRGNIGTRLSRIPDGGAIVMAVAALEVLGITDEVARNHGLQIIEIEQMVPMIGQGCVAVEHRADDSVTASLLKVVDHEPTRTAVSIERAFLAELGSGCSLPVAAHVHHEVLHTFMADERGEHWVTDSVALPVGDVEAACVVARHCAVTSRAQVW